MGHRWTAALEHIDGQPAACDRRAGQPQRRGAAERAGLRRAQRHQGRAACLGCQVQPAQGGARDGRRPLAQALAPPQHGRATARTQGLFGRPCGVGGAGGCHEDEPRQGQPERFQRRHARPCGRCDPHQRLRSRAASGQRLQPRRQQRQLAAGGIGDQFGQAGHRPAAAREFCIERRPAGGCCGHRAVRKLARLPDRHVEPGAHLRQRERRRRQAASAAGIGSGGRDHGGQGMADEGRWSDEYCI